jgi:hypothetical protein
MTFSGFIAAVLAIKGLALTDESWCCDRCREAAVRANQATSDRHGTRYAHTQDHQHRIIRATLQVIEVADTSFPQISRGTNTT